MLQFGASLLTTLAKARQLRSQLTIINYDHNSSFIVLATVITIINYNHHLFIVQATGLGHQTTLKNGNKLSTSSYNFDENNKRGCYFISRQIFNNLNKTGYIQSERLGACSIKPFCGNLYHFIVRCTICN
jgi:hypothetical protein